MSVAGRRPGIVAAAFWAAGAVVVALALVSALTPGTPAPRHVADWYVGTWRFTAPMVGVADHHLVRQKTAAAGVVRVTDDAHGLRVSMTGFPGVSSAAVAGEVTPLVLGFETPDVGQGIGYWELILDQPPAAALRFYYPSTGALSAHLPLTRE